MSDAEQWGLVAGRVCHDMDVDFFRVLSCERPSEIATARQVAHYILRVGMGWTFKRIGKASGRCHGAVHHNIRAIKNRISVEPNLRASVERLMKEVSR